MLAVCGLTQRNNTVSSRQRLLSLGLFVFFLPFFGVRVSVTQVLPSCLQKTAAEKRTDRAATGQKTHVRAPAQKPQWLVETSGRPFPAPDGRWPYSSVSEERGNILRTLLGLTQVTALSNRDRFQWNWKMWKYELHCTVPPVCLPASQ